MSDDIKEQASEKLLRIGYALGDIQGLLRDVYGTSGTNHTIPDVELGLDEYNPPYETVATTKAPEVYEVTREELLGADIDTTNYMASMVAPSGHGKPVRRETPWGTIFFFSGFVAVVVAICIIGRYMHDQFTQDDTEQQQVEQVDPVEAQWQRFEEYNRM